MNTPAQSAAITFDYLLTGLNRFGIMSASEKDAFWKHAMKSALDDQTIQDLRVFLTGQK